MSYTTAMGVVPNQRPAYLREFRNSHGWAPSIWSRLIKHRYGFDGYLHHGEGATYLDRCWREIEDMPEWQQIPNVLTFDTGVIPMEAALEAAALLDEFDRRLPEREGYANHVPAMAALLREQPEAPLFGVWGTSVSENPFDPLDEEADDAGNGIPLDEMYVLPQHREIVLNATYKPLAGGEGDL